MIDACSFCEKRKAEVAVLISAPRAMICEECIALCVRAIAARVQDMAKIIKIDGAPEDAS